MGKRINSAKLFVLMVLITLITAIAIQPSMAVSSNKTTKPAIKAPKYVFLFIGDGMGAAQRQITEYYMQEKKKDPTYKLMMNKLPVAGINTTHAADSLVTDSSSAGTALACGYKTNNGMVSVLPDKTKVKTLFEAAEEKGIATGLVTTTRVTHATPAVFAAHNADRDAENEIAEDMMDSGVDFVAGGGLRHFIPKSSTLGKSKRTDERNLLSELSKQYTVYTGTNSTQSFLNLKPTGQKKVWGVFYDSHMPYEIDRISHEINVPTLAQMTLKGIEVLSQYKNGFMMMVEGGRIDHACHANDAAGAILDTLAFDEAIKAAYDFYTKHQSETLLLVVGDHETGGMGMGFGSNYYLKLGELFDCQLSVEDTLSAGYAAYKKGANRAEYFSMIEAEMGLDNLTDAEKAEITRAMDLIDSGAKSDAVYGSYNQAAIAVAHNISERANIQWTTYAHSGTAIPLSAVGLNASLFGGYKDNTEIGKALAEMMGFKLGPVK